MIAVPVPFRVTWQKCFFQPPLENFQIRQTMCDTLFVRFSNMATNQVTVNPPVPLTVLKLRVKGCMLLTLHVML